MNIYYQLLSEAYLETAQAQNVKEKTFESSTRHVGFKHEATHILLRFNLPNIATES